MLNETSLWTRLYDEVRMRAHTPTDLFLALVHLWLLAPGPISTPKYLAWFFICICRKTRTWGTWVPTHSESCGRAKFPCWIQWHFLWFRDMLVTASVAEKAFATVGRDSRKDAVARAKSSVHAQADLCRNHGL